MHETVMSIYLVKLAHAHVQVIINYPYSIAQMCTWRYARPQFRHTLFDHKRKHKRKSQSYKLELIQPYTLVGPPVKRPVLALLAVYSSRTIYISPLISLFISWSLSIFSFFLSFSISLLLLLLSFFLLVPIFCVFFISFIFLFVALSLVFVNLFSLSFFSFFLSSFISFFYFSLICFHLWNN